jgi:imidazolonepropionase-like amidohydrolase
MPHGPVTESDGSALFYSGALCQCASDQVANVQRRLDKAFSRRDFLQGAMAMAAGAGGLIPQAQAQQSASQADAPTASTLVLRNVLVFDGIRTALQPGLQVVIKGSRIQSVEPQGQGLPHGARLIDGGGKILMPGLIDAHWHSLMSALSMQQLLMADPALIHLAAGAEAQRTLLRGFTAVRDAGGPVFALKNAIDQGMLPGPRIFPSGAMISQTAGHGDFRFLHEVGPGAACSAAGHAERLGASAIADSADSVRKAAREQLLRGASQIKVMAGGGASSLYDPLDTVQFTLPELRAAVEAADDWGTYVMAHVYLPKGMRRCIEAGIRVIEHGQLTDEDTVRMMADQNVVWSLQPFLPDTAPGQKEDASSQAKSDRIATGTMRAYALAIKHKVQTAWGSDILFAPGRTHFQSVRLTALEHWYAPLDALRQATSQNAAVLALSGQRNPYLDAKLGVIEPGAWADLLLVEGDLSRSLKPLLNPDRHLKVIVKNGQVVRNTL